MLSPGRMKIIVPKMRDHIIMIEYTQYFAFDSSFIFIFAETAEFFPYWETLSSNFLIKWIFPGREKNMPTGAL